jgi:hypothetical protein
MGEPTRLGDVLTVCAEAAGTAPRWVEASDGWLQEQGVAPWSGPESLPLWLPQPEYAGFMTRSTASARTAGLTTRPVLQSARAALRWEREQGLHRSRRAGITPEREAGLLATLSDAAR